MATERIFLGCFLLLLGATHLKWPQVIWELRNIGWVRGGEPTDFAITFIRIAGLITIAIGVFVLAGLGEIGSGYGPH